MWASIDRHFSPINNALLPSAPDSISSIHIFMGAAAKATAEEKESEGNDLAHFFPPLTLDAAAAALELSVSPLPN